MNNKNESQEKREIVETRRKFLTSVGAAVGGIVAVGGALLPKQANAHAVAWEQPGNNNHVLALQEGKAKASGGVTLDYYGHCAFKLTSPAGVTVMFDPWRNDPSGAWGLWYPKEFPKTVVDIGMSTHAHFDHDALERVDATMILDRMVGSWEFSDVKIHGIADKHACVAPGWYKWTDVLAEFGAEACPPNNPGHLDNVMYVVETGGMRIAMWGDNRHNPSEYALRQLGDIDVLTLPVDGSQHILSYDQGDDIVARLRPKVIIPTHYLCEGISLTLTTLQTADEWVAKQKNRTHLSQSSLVLEAGEVKKMNGEFMYFGSNAVKPA